MFVSLYESATRKSVEHDWRHNVSRFGLTVITTSIPEILLELIEKGLSFIDFGLVAGIVGAAVALALACFFVSLLNRA